MPLKMSLLSTPLLACVCLPLPILAQNSSSQPKSQTAEAKQSETLAAPFVLKQYTRMVNLDVVVEDSKGNHIRGLKAEDFDVYEQTPTKSRKKSQQKIVEVREIHTAGMKPPVEAPAETSPGVYTNAVAAQKDPVPPTVLLVDGINTEIQYQAQVHRQMLRMLRQLPPNVPTAVFLMGDHLRLLQGFTTDPQLLQAALAKAESVTGEGLGHLNPKDDASAPGNQLYGLDSLRGGGDISAGIIEGVQKFDQAVYAANITERFDRTYTAFLSIARSLVGYPGRKNVLWLSTSFPLTLNVFPQSENSAIDSGMIQDTDEALVNNWAQVKVLNNALSAAKIAVYPVDVGGVRTLQTYSAATRPANPFASGATTVDAQRVAGAESREMEMQNNEQDTMQSIAKDTGGKVCIGSNDLGKCIRDAMNDSSDFYEISYYPDSTDWNGEYRKVSVNVRSHGAHLSYRQGYYATDEANPDPKVQQAEMQADCGVLLNATGIAFTAMSLPPDAAGRLNFSLEIDPSALTFTPAADGQQKMDLEVGVCTFDRKGWSQKLMAYPLQLSLNENAYRTLITGGRLRDSIFVPGPKPAAVRVIVKDIPSGRLGSIYIQTDQSAEAPPQSARNGATPKAPH